MTTNYKQPGDRLTVPAPHAVTKGNFVVLNATTGFGGVALDNALSAANVVLAVGAGVYTFSKPNAVSTSALIGANVHWDNTNSQATTSATSNVLIGQAAAAFGNTDTSVDVRMRRF